MTESPPPESTRARAPSRDRAAGPGEAPAPGRGRPPATWFSGSLPFPFLVALPLLLSVLRTGSPAGTGAPVEDREATPMKRALREAAVESSGANPYMGFDPLDRIRRELASDSPIGAKHRGELLRDLGQEELRVGREGDAIEHLSEARELFERPGARVSRTARLDVIFDLAVAHMRQGETQNCCFRRASQSCIFPIEGNGVHLVRAGSEAAVGCLLDVLAEAPPAGSLYLKARWLLNVCHMTLGSYPDGVEAKYRLDPELFAADEAFPRFEDVAPRVGLASFDLAGGAVVEDFDGDERLDVISSTSDPEGPMHFWHNAGDGTFDERTTAAGLDGLVGGLNMVQADYDNDGDVDVLVLRGAWWRELGCHPNSLLRNDGAGRFTDVTFAAGMGERHYPTQTAAWADYDNDGDLDLYVGNEYGAGPYPCQLFRNQGDGTFVDVAEEVGVRNLGFAKAVVWGDYDGDRWPDLFVSNMGDRNRLYHNAGDGTFTDVAVEAGVARPISSFPSWFWDFDNDGALDLYVASYGGEQRPPDLADVVRSYLGMPFAAERSRLYRGDGAGHFTNVAGKQGLNLLTFAMGSNFGDLDNDGWLDFYLGTGFPYYEGLMPNLMYRNRGGTGFANVTTAGGFGHLQKGHAVVFADLDDDGDQDVLEQLGGQYPGDAFGNVLYENPGASGHWLKVRLVGTTSNRSGLGARLRLDVVEDGRPRSIWRWVGTGGSFGGNPLRQEIGLGGAEVVQRLEIWWPTSDTTQVFEDVAADRMIVVEEGSDAFTERRLQPFRFGDRPLPH